MGKGLLIAVLFVGLAIAADKQYNYGMYTDTALAMLRQMRHGFGI